MTLEQVALGSAPVLFSDLAKTALRPLAREVQNRLTALGLLDPVIEGNVTNAFKPAVEQDGLWGPATEAMLRLFGRLARLEVDNALSRDVAGKLLTLDSEAFLPLRLEPEAGDTAQALLGKRILRYIQRAGYWIARAPGMWNVVYIEGVDANGGRNGDADNGWNDRRLLIRVGVGGVPQIGLNAEATTEPCRAFARTAVAKARKGAARIAFGQYKAWRMGFHKRPGHVALQQCDRLRVHRDLDGNGLRIGDAVYVQAGLGINQHSTREGFTGRTVDRWSEGCLVGRLWQEHLDFIRLLREDVRYVIDPNYVFMSTVINGDHLG
jgi:hypothetical protein